MFNPTQIVIDAFVRELQGEYERTYGLLEPSYPGVIGFVARIALEISLIATRPTTTSIIRSW